MLKFLLAVTIAVAATTACAAEQCFTDVDAALAEASKTDKRVFVVFSLEGCGPCEKLEKEIGKEQAAKAIEAYVCCKINATRDRSTARTYRVNSCPSLMILDPNKRGLGRSKAVKTATGFMTAGDLAVWLKP